jgi:hypothetical protein
MQQKGPGDDLRAQLADPDMIALYDYWLAQRRGRRMPSRRDLDPVDLPRQLPNIMLIDVQQPPLRFRYRLVGTRVVEASAEDRTGYYFDTVEFFALNPIIMAQYQQVVDSGSPLFSLEPFKNFVNDTTYQVERLILPLSADGKTVDMLLVHFSFKTGPWGRG